MHVRTLGALINGRKFTRPRFVVRSVEPPKTWRSHPPVERAHSISPAWCSLPFDTRTRALVQSISLVPAPCYVARASRSALSRTMRDTREQTTNDTKKKLFIPVQSRCVTFVCDILGDDARDVWPEKRMRLKIVRRIRWSDVARVAPTRN